VVVELQKFTVPDPDKDPELVGVSGSVSRKAKKEKDLQKFLVLKNRMFSACRLFRRKSFMHNEFFDKKS
jgi:hypothetical protein